MAGEEGAWAGRGLPANKPGWEKCTGGTGGVQGALAAAAGARPPRYKPRETRETRRQAQENTRARRELVLSEGVA